jgi:hypothetical protein
LFGSKGRAHAGINTNSRLFGSKGRARPFVRQQGASARRHQHCSLFGSKGKGRLFGSARRGRAHAGINTNRKGAAETALLLYCCTKKDKQKKGHFAFL